MEKSHALKERKVKKRKVRKLKHITVPTKKIVKKLYTILPSQTNARKFIIL